MSANTIRGEVDIDLAGTTFTLRPSYEAIVACEAATGMALTEMALAADRGAMSINDAAVVVTEMVRAWGRETASASARGVSVEKVGKLIFAMGVMVALPRIAIVLGQAASGGVDASGKAKPMPEMMIPPGIGESSQGSPPPPSDGEAASSGARRRTSSGRRSKPGGK